MAVGAVFSRGVFCALLHLSLDLYLVCVHVMHNWGGRIEHLVRMAVNELVRAVDLDDTDEQQHGEVPAEHIIVVVRQLAQHAQRDLRAAELADDHR